MSITGDDLRQSPVMLTGATGLVGASVLRALRSRGYRVRALVRHPAGLEPGGDLELVLGDLNHPESLERAVRGCSAVIHYAADYRLSLRPAEVSGMVAVNVGGIANVIRAAREAGLRRLVHCSTVGTLAFDRSGRVCSEEDQAPSPAALSGPYKRSKWAAERLALGSNSPQLEVVVVQPSTPVGAGDVRPTPTGATIRDFLRGRIPAVVETGLNLVDVEAVGMGHVLALERGVGGRSYILGDQNLTLRELLGRVAAIAGVRPPRWRIPIGAAYLAALASESWGTARSRPPAISLTSVRMAAHPMYVDPTRAVAELGWAPGDLDRALREAVAQLRPPRLSSAG